MPKLRYKKDDKWEEIQVSKSPFRIGRGLENDLAIDSFFISRVHCELIVEQGSWQLHDMGSKIGTKINRKEALRPVPMNSGDVMSFGDRFEIVFIMEDDNTETLRSQAPDVTKNEFRLVALNGPLANQSFLLDRNLTRIGRGPHNEIRLSLDTVSTDHAEILRKGQEFTLVDLNSANGTLVGGKRIQSVVLQSEQSFNIDWVQFRFEDSHYRVEKTGTLLTRTNAYPALASPDDPLYKSLIGYDPLQMGKKAETALAAHPSKGSQATNRSSKRNKDLWIVLAIFLFIACITAGVGYYLKDWLLALLKNY